MRRLWILFLGVGLLSTALGCVKTLQYTAGICDCNPPPVETVLAQPCPQYHPIVNPYTQFAPPPYVPVSNPGAVPAVQAAPAQPQMIVPPQVPTPSAGSPLPSGGNPPVIINGGNPPVTPTADKPVERVPVLPKAADSDK